MLILGLYGGYFGAAARGLMPTVSCFPSPVADPLVVTNAVKNLLGRRRAPWLYGGYPKPHTDRS